MKQYGSKFVLTLFIVAWLVLSSTNCAEASGWTGAGLGGALEVAIEHFLAGVAGSTRAAA